MKPRVLAAIDNSMTAGSVLTTARALADLYDADVDVVHVREDGHRHVSALAQAEQLPITILEEGDVASAIAESARAPDVVALVLGTRSTPDGLARAGHITQSVACSMLKPVVVVPPGVDHHRELRRMLVPLDGDITTSEAAAAVMRLARKRGVDLVVLHVLDECTMPPFEDQAQYEAVAWREEFTRRHCRPLGDEASLELRTGIPSGEILDVARSIDADAILVAWGGDLSEHRATVVHELLERSRAPLILIPLVGEAKAQVPKRVETSAV